MKQLASLTLALAALAPILSAVETQTWTQSQQDEFTKGTLKGLSVRSDGRLFLAPLFHEIFDPSTAYLWALARDSKGVLYTGGGGPGSGTASLFRIPPGGPGKSIAELPGLEIHAIAIDSQDRVYAATSPDGKVYRIAAKGAPEVFYDPHAKYIWAMVFDRQGNLYVATGDQGDIHRVTPGGKGSVFFRTEETHARSMTIDRQGNLIAGTEPGGLILRISPAAEGFVLYQAAKREVTAVAVAPDGAIYAAAAGSKPSVAPPPPPPAPVPVPSPSPSSPAVPMIGSARSQPPPTLVPAASGLAGSEVYRVDLSGQSRRVWSDAREIVYAIGFDRDSRPILGTGNKGNIYRLDSPILATLLVNSAPTQVTSLTSASDGTLYAVTGNIGKVYQVGPGQEKDGTLESDVFDAGSFTDWGRLSWKGTAQGGAVAFQTRTGNLDRPQKNWSPWAAVEDRIPSPSARFLEWKLTMKAAPGGASPDVNSVEVAYQPRNIAPVVSLIEITPVNYKFQSQSLTLTPSTSITLPPIGAKRNLSTPVLGSSSQTLPHAKGHIGARWLASDDNGDEMKYTVEIRGVNETLWKKLKSDLTERYYSWDSTAFPDGEYVLRVTASDAPDNPPGNALEAQLASEPFVIDNTPPQITGLAASAQGNKLTVKWQAADTLNPIETAEYSVNGGDWKIAEPTTRLSDSPRHDYALTIDRPQGEVTIAVRVSDRFENQSVASTLLR